jgi:hypothetical protein
MCKECVLNKTLKKAIEARKEGEVCIKVNNGNCSNTKEGKCWLNITKEENKLLAKNREEV